MKHKSFISNLSIGALQKYKLFWFLPNQYCKTSNYFTGLKPEDKKKARLSLVKNFFFNFLNRTY